MVAPDPGAPVLCARLGSLNLLTNLVRCGVEAAQVVRVKKIKCAGFTNLKDRIHRGARSRRLAGKKHRASGAEVAVLAVPQLPICGREIVLNGHHAARQVEIQHTHRVLVRRIAIRVSRYRGGIDNIRSVTGGEEHPAIGVVDRIVHLANQTRPLIQTPPPLPSALVQKVPIG